MTECGYMEGKQLVCLSQKNAYIDLFSIQGIFKNIQHIQININREIEYYFLLYDDY